MQREENRMMNEANKGTAAAILLVDDDLMSQKVGRAMLTHFGCRVDVAGSGGEALDALSRQRYDMVFMDCQMPGMNGYEATGVIREKEAHERAGGDAVVRIPIVALTGMATDEDREQCLQAGMDDYLSKPFSVATMQSLLNRWLPVPQDRAPEGTEGEVSSGAETPRATAGDPSRHDDRPALDRKALTEIAALQPPGGDDILKKVISLYLDSSRTLMQAIRKAAGMNDADALCRTAHTLKSSSAYVGALTFSGMCEELEMIGRGNMMEGFAARLAALDQEYVRVQDALEKIRDGAAADLSSAG
jgi:two-component system sensor histidine kinase/response regulator